MVNVRSYVYACVSFPSVVVRPKMLGILVGVDQKDRYTARLAALVVVNGSGMFMSGFAGDDAFNAAVCRQARDARHHGFCSFQDVATLIVDNGCGMVCPCCELPSLCNERCWGWSRQC